MKVGDLVVFRSDTVPGVVVAEKRGNADQHNQRIGVVWSDCHNEVFWEPVKLMRVISETENKEREHE